MDEKNRNYVLDILNGNHQYAQEKLHKAIVSLVIALAVSIVLFVSYAWHVSNTMRKMTTETEQKWLDYLSQYDFSGSEYTQDGNGVNLIGDRNGVTFNGPETFDPQPDAENEE